MIIRGAGRKSVLAVILAISLAGCSSSTGAGGDKGSASPSSEPAFNYTGAGPVTDQKDAKLSILGTNAWTTNVDLSTAEIVKKIESNAGVTVDWDLIPPQNYADAVNPRLAAGTGLPDIVYLPDQDQLMKYINSGLFIPLNDLVEKYGVNLKKYTTNPHPSKPV